VNILKILWITNIPSPYRVDFFNGLGRYCDLTVLFEKPSSKERDASWNKFDFKSFNGIILEGIEIDTDKSLSLTVIKYLSKNKYDHIVVANTVTPTGIIAIQYMKLLGIPYILEGDGAFPKSGQGMKERFKMHLIKGAKAYFSTAKPHDNYYLKYGANREAIFRYPFTSIKGNDLLRNPLNSYEKKKFKNRIGVKEDKMILSIGQFIYRKGFDILLNACSDLDRNVGVYIIGGQPTDEYLSLIEKLKLTNIYFEGFKKKELLSDYFKAADLFVLPTREDIWGLVINEAMASGLPVITTNRCIAGLELITDNYNGFLVSINDAENLSEKINLVVNNDQLRESMGRNSLQKIKSYTIEEMVKRHINLFKELQ
jgi:glycosyltransferase involved in cell wall biosynthesis